MLEVLVTLLVVSVALAGMAALQMNSLQHVHSAHYRSLASSIALDFEERLWLELADNAISGCPDVTNAGGSTADELLTAWTRSTFDGETMLKIPNLAVTMGTPVTGTSVTRVPITLSWGESRFTDTGEAATESYTFNVRILCRKVST